MDLTNLSDVELDAALAAAQDPLDYAALEAVMNEMCGRARAAGVELELVCPTCGAREVEDNTLPVNDWVWNIRPNKVGDDEGRWWSHCLVCAAGDPAKGWFTSELSAVFHMHRRGAVK